jgi:hypothetical protein
MESPPTKLFLSEFSTIILFNFTQNSTIATKRFHTIVTVIYILKKTTTKVSYIRTSIAT